MTDQTTTTPSPVLKTAEELNDLRARVLAGEEFSSEEYSEIIRAYRANRMSAVSASASKTRAAAASAAKKAPQDLGELMKGLGL